MNFGNWIVVSFVLFASFMTGLVIVCMRQDVSLVSKNYYDEELQFQDQIEREQNTERLETKPSLQLNGTVLTLSWNQSAPVTGGTINLFCPANAQRDRTFAISGAHERHSFQLHEVGKGMYRVRLRWTIDNKEYYQEEVINL